MPLHSLKMVQKIPAGIDEVWEMFSNPANLLQLTPPHLRLRIISAGDQAVIFTGQRIEYTLTPLLRIQFHWTTEIRGVDKRKYFMDKQMKGPYRLWEHQHFFKPIEGGVEMTDAIRYQNPLGILGKFANSFIVRNRLRQIFEYRYRQVENIFGTWEGQQPVILFS